MLNRDSISQALSQMLLKVQARDVEQVQSQASLLIENLDRLIQPIPDPTNTETSRTQPPTLAAELQGVSVANVRYVRSLISEVAVLSRSDHWEAAKNAMQRAIDRWNEELVSGWLSG